MKAAYGGYTKCVEYLIKAGADPDMLDEEECVALIQAARKGEAEIVKCLLGSKTKLNSLNQACAMTGDNALRAAAYNGRTECVQLLVDAKADVN